VAGALEMVAEWKTRARGGGAFDRIRNSDVEGSERRQWERVLVDLEVDYGNEENYLFAYIRDISATGIFVRTNSPEPPGTRLNLRFTPPGAPDPFELEGEVIWINPYRPGHSDNLHPGMGIRFIGLTDEDRERLVEFIKTFAYLADDVSDDVD
jgi:type IV pilus assembly protein PilZ